MSCCEKRSENGRKIQQWISGTFHACARALSPYWVRLKRIESFKIAVTFCWIQSRTTTHSINKPTQLKLLADGSGHGQMKNWVARFLAWEGKKHWCERGMLLFKSTWSRTWLNLMAWQELALLALKWNMQHALQHCKTLQKAPMSKPFLAGRAKALEICGHIASFSDSTQMKSMTVVLQHSRDFTSLGELWHGV